jgi:aryl-alcohol dehydrogenase-like predicted oxidoreductase
VTRRSGEPAARPVPVGPAGRPISRLGFGCYRVDDETPAHREALEAALLSGCTLIDTSTNYADGASESLVGRVLADLAAAGRVRRESLTVVSKIGYVQGRNLDLALERERSGRPFPEMVKYMDGCWHCIHPEFLEDQLGRSLERLGSLDVCLLHNPEYFLSDAKKRRRDLETTRHEFDRRLRDAFAFLEDAVRRGRIACYGVSSNTAVVPAGDAEATSIARMLAAATEAGGPGHHFRVAQFPLNLFEPGAALNRNTGPKGARTALEEAAAAGLTILVNRPLNAFRGERLIRLADPPVPEAAMTLAQAVTHLEDLEEEYRRDIAPAGGNPEGAADHLFELVAQVAALPGPIDDLARWRQIEGQYVIPRVNQIVAAIARSVLPGARERWSAWWARFLPALQDLLREIGRGAAREARRRAQAIGAALDRALPEGRRSESLSRKALWVVASTPAVSCVLVGMRRPDYVRDAMEILGWPPLEDPLRAYRAMDDLADGPP